MASSCNDFAIATFSSLANLFNIIMSVGYVLYGLRLSYTVPLPKVDSVGRPSIPKLLITTGPFQSVTMYRKF